jgi:hypothetical protein
MQTVRARLCLYFENNLLQSALIEAGVDAPVSGPAAWLQEAISRRAHERFLARGGVPGDDRGDWLTAEREVRTRAGILRDRANSVRVDFALTETFQELQARYARRTVQFQPEREQRALPVALNLTLNDDGSGGHRLLVKTSAQALSLRVPYDTDGVKALLEDARTRLQAVFCLRNADGSPRRNGNNPPDVDSGLARGKRHCYDSFKYDLIDLARFGRDLFDAVTTSMRCDGQSTGAQLTTQLDQVLAQRAVIQAVRIRSDQYVFPWALVYDIPLDQNPAKWHMCPSVQELWSGKEGANAWAAREDCPHRQLPRHDQDYVCPFGFWGLRHIIEQPPSAASADPTPGSGAERLLDAETNLKVGPHLALAVGVTRDPQLDQNVVNAHLKALVQNGRLNLQPSAPADTATAVQAMLQAPVAVYFLCHGEFDSQERKVYLGVGLRDASLEHRVYPTNLHKWARLKSGGLDLWRGRGTGPWSSSTVAIPVIWCPANCLLSSLPSHGWEPVA